MRGYICVNTWQASLVSVTGQPCLFTAFAIISLLIFGFTVFNGLVIATGAISINKIDTLGQGSGI